MCSCKRHGDQYATCTCSCPHPAPTTPTPETPDDAARADIDLDAVRKRHEAASDEVVRLCSPGGRWRMSIPADEKRDSDLVLDVALADIPALVAEVRDQREVIAGLDEAVTALRHARDRQRDLRLGLLAANEALVEAIDAERDELRRLTESLDAARSVAEHLEDEVSVERTRTIKAEAELDALRATVERVEALADEDEWGHNEGCEGEPSCPACWAQDIRAALHPQECVRPDHPNGAKDLRCLGCNGTGVEPVDYDPAHPFVPQQWADQIRALDPEAFDAAERGAAYIEFPIASGRDATCGDRLGTWHGPIGPCVLTGRHTLHDDGAGITWSRTNVPDLTGEPS